jgi:hypothetical protein
MAKALVQAERRNKLGLLIREWLVAEAQPTVSSVCRTFGISAAHFQELFPEEEAEVVRRPAGVPGRLVRFVR